MDYSKILCYMDMNLGDRNLETPVPKNYKPDPQRLIANELDQLNDPNRRAYVDTDDGRFSNIAYFLHHKLDPNELEPMIEWAKKTFPLLSEFPYKYGGVEDPIGDWMVHLQTTWPKSTEKTGWQTPHVDMGRAGELIYFIDLGGENIVTSWYHDPNSSLYKHETMKNIRDIRGWKEITNTILKPKTWYYFRTDIVHGAKFLTDKRIALVITFTNRHKSRLNDEFYEYLHKIHKNFELKLQ